MYRKASICVIFVILLLLTYLIFIGNVDFRPYYSTLLQLSAPPPAPAPAHSLCSIDRPLRVYMYDLPRKFNVGMMGHQESQTDQEGPVTKENLPPWPVSSGIRNQHSVEYWLMASLLCDDEEGEREAIRVLDPETADAFFVPFFSSLSFNTYGHNMRDPKTELDRQLQIEVMEFLRQSKYWQRSKGRDHVIPMTHPNAFKFLRQQVNASILIVVDFGRYPRSIANLNKDVVSPYVHVVKTFMYDYSSDPFESRTTLLFFRGGTVRKDGGKIRAKLAKVLAGYDDVHYEQSIATTKAIEASTKGMRSSKFCLDPAGDTPSSCRLFDAIVSHCVPVIVSDQVELPFEDELDYTEFSVFFSMKEALEPDYMVNKLRKIPKERWLGMWSRLKNISHHYEFQYPPKKVDAVNMLWRQVKNKLPGAELAAHRSRRLKIPDKWKLRR